MTRELSIGVFRSTLGPRLTYSFRLAPREQIVGLAREGEELVRTAGIPERFKQVLQKFGRQNGGGARIGYITYLRGLHPDANGQVASVHYHPKDGLGGLRTRHLGMGYFLEALAVHDLQRNGITGVRTSMSASQERRSQLQKAGLEPERVYRPREWLRGLGRGLKASSKTPEPWIAWAIRVLKEK